MRAGRSGARAPPHRLRAVLRLKVYQIVSGVKKYLWQVVWSLVRLYSGEEASVCFRGWKAV